MAIKLKLRPSDAALLFRSNGTIESFIPTPVSDEPPDHVLMAQTLLWATQRIDVLEMIVGSLERETGTDAADG